MSIRRRSSASFVALVCASLLVAGVVRADDDALAPYRDRFRVGMEKYKAGALAEAIRIWNGIYEEIGSTRGYRLSFDLARAYDTNGETTRAADRYRSFLDEAARRAKAGEEPEALVLREVHDAETRLEALQREHGRIEVVTRADRPLTQVDDADPRLGGFTAYVAPGRHVVTFGLGRADAEKVDVTVAAGELVVAHDSHVDPLPPVATRRETRHPFSAIVLYAGGVATAVSTIAPILAYEHAASLSDTFYSSTATPSARTAASSQYPNARGVAYGMLAIPITLGAITGGLTTWYLAGAEERTVTVSAGLGSASVSGTF